MFSGILTSNFKWKSYILPKKSLLPHANFKLFSLSFLNVDIGHIMTDLLDKGNVASLLRDKTIMLLGSYVIRGLYKDLVWLQAYST